VKTNQVFFLKTRFSKKNIFAVTNEEKRQLPVSFLMFLLGISAVLLLGWILSKAG